MNRLRLQTFLASSLFFEADKGGGSGGAAVLSLEQRLVIAEADCATHGTQITALGERITVANTERDAERTRAEGLALQVTSITGERDALNGRLVAADARNVSFLGTLRDTLQLDAAALEKLGTGDATVIASAIAALAQRKAIDIAAGQGTPAVPTKPNIAVSKEDEAAALRSQANEEKDPAKRASLHRRASSISASTKTHGAN